MAEDFDWNKGDRIERLKRFWAEGLTCGQISRKFKGAVSAAAVIGKVHRLKLPARPARGHKPKPPPILIHDRVVQLRPRTKPLPVVREPHPEPLRMESGALIGIMEVRDCHCRWPHGDVGTPDFHFCGQRPKAGSPYCEVHARRGVQPRGKREEESPQQTAATAERARQAERQFSRMWG